MAYVISRFSDEYSYLSNFYPYRMIFNGLVFENAEAAFQAQKVIDYLEQLRFCGIDASTAKKLGRKVVLRSDWEAVKDDVMLDVVREKFYQNPDLAHRLLDTGYAALIEGNTWGDRYWGMCGGQGQNKLGYILMRIRAEIEWEKQAQQKQ